MAIDTAKPTPRLTVTLADPVGYRGEALMVEMMRRGMIIEVDHMPRRTFQRAYELLEPIRFDGMQLRRDIGHRAVKR